VKLYNRHESVAIKFLSASKLSLSLMYLKVDFLHADTIPVSHHYFQYRTFYLNLPMWCSFFLILKSCI